MELLTHWYSPEQIKARVDWKSVKEDTPKQGTEDKRQTQGREEQEI